MSCNLCNFTYVKYIIFLAFSSLLPSVLVYFIIITEYPEKGDLILKNVYLAHSSTDSGSANDQVVDEIIMTRTHVKKEIISPDGKEESLRMLNSFQHQTSGHLIVYTS